jgi:GTP pyrophosphokinase
MIYGERFEEALVLAARHHREQTRKTTGVPYVTHLLSVAALVGEAGGTEDEVIAALLHDAVEDAKHCTPREMSEEIRRRFGPSVADVVDACTDAFEIPKPPWRERKEAYLGHLASTSDSARLVSCADKLHNARSIVRDLRLRGASVWDRFKGGRDGTLWYYRSLVAAFREHGAPDMLRDELERTVEEMHRLAEE